jgi:signal transduction histidine kinase
MRLGIRTKQVAGVMAIVSLAIAVLGGWYLASLTRVLLDSSRSRARLLSNIVYQRTFTLLARGGEPVAALQADEGLRSVLESYAYSENLVYASIADPSGRILADADPSRIGTMLDSVGNLDDLIDRQGVVERLRAIYTPGGRTFELREPLTLGATDLGSIRIGVSTLLLRNELERQMITPLITAIVVLLASLAVATLLAQLVLRPIHVIRSGLARLGRGELDVNVDLPADAELGDLGESFRQVTARLAADRTEIAGQRAIESVVDRLEDAVALFATDGTVLFANAAMRPALGDARTLAADHPYRQAAERALRGDAAPEPMPAQVPGAGERLVITNLVTGADGQTVGVLVVARNIAYLSEVESTLSYSRKLSALNRLTAGIAHEIKNPLNAAMIHLELLRMQTEDKPEAGEHVRVIADQVRRLDEVVQGFLKFTRPEDLHLESVDLPTVFERLRPVVEAEAGKHKIDLRIDAPMGLPPVEGDPHLLDQAFLNLALNACQAMPEGGRLRISARPSPGRMVTVEVEDTGIGIAPEHLSRIFDLYFTTKTRGSGIGLSLVFRTVQLHNGEIEVESTPGRGTTFRLQLRQAARMFQEVGR